MSVSPFKVGQTSAQWAAGGRISHLYLPETASTNQVAKENGFNSAAIEIIFTDHQTAGRGRGDHTWEDGSGEGTLLSSWCFARQQTPPPLLSCLIGLAVYRACMGTWPWLNFSLKAPNDIYLDEKKLAGLLIENLQQGSQNKLIIGLGVNVFTKPSLPLATCLADQLKPEELSVKIWTEFLDRLLLEFSFVAHFSEMTLTDDQRQSLLYALNRWPLLSDKYLAVSPHGDLATAHSQISWKQL